LNVSGVFVDNVLVFGRLLRSAGLDVHLGRVLDAMTALSDVDISARDDVRHTLRTLLVHRHEQLATFDRAFDLFWRAHALDDARRPRARSEVHDLRRDSTAADADQSPSRWMAVPVDASLETTADGREVGLWSDTGGLAHKDFARFSEQEMALARATLERLVWTPGQRRTRRWVAVAGQGRRIDLRRALSRSRRTGGEVVSLPRRTRRIRPRGLVLLCDVSGSMERYSRMLLHFAHAMGHRYQPFEAFLFSTELTRITGQLRTRRVDHAVAAVSGSVAHWSGGTRIGESLREFHQRWGRRVLTRGPVVLLVSDGWDRGEPSLLRDEIARLQRSSHRLIWLNPLIGTADYAPLTRGLRAALPFVDDFLPVRTLSNIADLAVHLNKLDGG
jgi:hypothetical protein